MNLWSFLFTNKAIFPPFVLPIQSARVAAPSKLDAMLKLEDHLKFCFGGDPRVVIVHAGIVKEEQPKIVRIISWDARAA